MSSAKTVFFTSDSRQTTAMSPFSNMTPLPQRSALRKTITQAWCRPEIEAVPELLSAASVPSDIAERVHTRARQLVNRLRTSGNGTGKSGLVQSLLQEFSLSSQEGVALMCLAEALLRIPDVQTRDALIRDKLQGGNWKEHLGQSPSMFVNAASWGLMLTGKLVATYSETGMTATLRRLVARGGEPLIRKGVDVAMRMMGEQFVTGQTIDEALRNAVPFEARGFQYSYDMLGEAALTADDARRYLADYERAIHAIGKFAKARGPYDGPGISIKLSALHPRYRRAQVDRVMDELYPVLRDLAVQARHYNMGLNIDAEEAQRLELSLDLFERLCHEPELRGWDGLGFVVQAYQKRCPFVVDYLIDLAQRSQRRLMVRLVKGAYWDTEIKQAQVDGLDGYPVYTRKAYSDISYIACARKLLAAPESIFPQFATHNAQTLATIYELAGADSYWKGQYEFQCLHGMGEPLYEHIIGNSGQGRPCRIYAPVGSHDTLLAYLVRRLLENGANTSFVNQIADQSFSVETLTRDPAEQVREWAEQEGQVGLPHPRIPLPAHIYGDWRKNSRGLDLNNEQVLASLVTPLQDAAGTYDEASPMLAIAGSAPDTIADSIQERSPVVNPADHRDVVGYVRRATAAEVDRAIAAATDFAPVWAAVEPDERAAILLGAADHFEQHIVPMIGLLVREAGKTYANAVAEVREAVDFLRYYSAQVRTHFRNDTHRPLGPVTCISPWNFPLAIFTGQVAASLAAGNTVLAKPADQTCLIAAMAIRLLHKAGVPPQAVQLVPGRGRVIGPLLTDDDRIQGVMFTGSTAVAKGLQQTLARRLSPSGQAIALIAETGGQNAMIVDSSALAEQVVEDVIMSAFDSAGQRCSALRVLFVQDDVADRLIAMIKGAMNELLLGDPAVLANDVGPVIDAQARDSINAHIDAMRSKGRRVHQLSWGHPDARQAIMEQGTYVRPTLIELESLSELTDEVFGPVLHVLRYRHDELDRVLEDIRDTGYGLTMGLHTRIDETIHRVTRQASVGNVYVNRNMVGAVVGVQPFGGQGLSGTGPKAGGPLYLYRLLSARPDGVLEQPFGVLGVAEEWTQRRSSPVYELAGPTGEQNLYERVPPRAVLCRAHNEADFITQLDAVIAVGSCALWDGQHDVAAHVYASLPKPKREHIILSSDWQRADFNVAIHHGDADDLQWLLGRLADRDGVIVPVVAMKPGDTRVPLDRLVRERAISINTAAAGGNASLMTMA